MYGLQVSDEDALLVETLHAFAEGELRAAARDAERAGCTPAALQASLHQLGVAAPVPEELGGHGIPGVATALRIAEELAWGDPGIAIAALQAGGAALLIAGCGSPEQQARHLPRFTAASPLRAALLVYEGFGRQPSELTTTAARDAGGWVLRGDKVGVLHPNDAELAVVVARDEHGALAAFVLDGRPPGWTVTRDDARSGKLGLEAAPTGDVRLAGVRVPEDARLSHAAALAGAIARIRLVHAAVLLGCARAAKEFAQRYANERVAFGRPIASFQGVAFPLADRDMAIDAARLELFDAAAAIAGERDAAAIEALCRCVVGRCGEVALQATRDGVQTLGGHGFIREYPVERWYRAAAALSALDFDPLVAPCDFLPA
jgi:alkylation response protein AidB-like acyl-CoA dehydrogenase